MFLCENHYVPVFRFVFKYLFSGPERTVGPHGRHRPYVVHARAAQRREKPVFFRYHYGRARQVRVPGRLFRSVFVATVHRLVGFHCRFYTSTLYLIVITRRRVSPLYFKSEVYLRMLETAVCDRSCPMKIVQNAIAIVFVLSGEFSSFTRPVLSSREFGSSLIELKPARNK